MTAFTPIRKLKEAFGRVYRKVITGSYYLKPGGAMVDNDWLLWGSQWYYLKTGGAMISGEWLEWGGNWYYLHPSGIMAADEWIGGWYYVDSGGVWTDTRAD